MSQLHFKKVTAGQAASQICERINHYTQNGTVLISLSGGSAITFEIAILSALRHPEQVTITLNDERYGVPTHDDSNWRQLESAGFDKSRFKAFEVLTGKDAEQTTKDFNNFLGNAQKNYDYMVSILGMGADGHTSGILPGSPAISSVQMAVYYEAVDYMRITNTPLFLSMQTEVWVLAYGQAKHEQINRLGEELSVAVQPIQIIKQVPNSTFYNDLKGDGL